MKEVGAEVLEASAEDKIDAEIMADPNAAMEKVSGVHPAMMGVKHFEVKEDVHKARAYERDKGTFWVAYNKNRNHIVIVAGDGQLWLDEGYMLKSVTFP